MQRSCPRALVLGTTLALSVASCGESAPETPPELPPLVGALEVPISFRNDAPAPSGALRIEASMNELRLEGQPVYVNLTRGLVPEGERSPEGLTLLLTNIRAAPARSRAAITFLGTVPYDTAVRVVQTLASADYHEVAFAVRPPGGSPTATGWLALSNPQIAPSEGPYTFAGGARRWEDFTAHWAEMYDACRAGHYIDCDGSPNTPVPGGEFQLVLWARGQGMQMRFNQLNAPAVEPTGPAPVAMIEGVPSATPTGEEPPPPPPDTSGVFSFRADEATNTETNEGGVQVPSSAISTTARPVCGAAPCSTLIEADAETPIMRVLSFIGAAFPNGSAAPVVAFRMPE